MDRDARRYRLHLWLAGLGFSCAYAALLWALTKPQPLRDLLAWLWG